MYVMYVWKVITTVQNALKRYSSVVHATVSPFLPDHTYMLQSIDLSMCTSVVREVPYHTIPIVLKHTVQPNLTITIARCPTMWSCC